MKLTASFVDFGRRHPELTTARSVESGVRLADEPSQHPLMAPITITLESEFRIGDRKAFREKIEAHWRLGVREFVIDCQDTLYIDAASTGMLIGTAKAVRELGGSMRLVHLTAEMAEHYRHIHMQRVVDIETAEGET